MRKFETRNRYNYLIVFEEIEENVFSFKSFNGKEEENRFMWRAGGTASNYDFVDPSGGPFVHVGTDLKDIDSKFPSLIVKSIDVKNGIKLYIE